LINILDDNNKDINSLFKQTLQYLTNMSTFLKLPLDKDIMVILKKQ